MALFVVACGILLMLGGAVSLLLGFDIVMTERGAAMTLGGVVALSGGVIAVGIGLALVRLNQLLRVLESRAAKPLRASAPDRPVVPIAVDEVRPPTAAPGPVAPLSPVRAPSAGDALIPAAAVAGVAAIGAATVLGRPSSEEEASALPAATSLPSSEWPNIPRLPRTLSPSLRSPNRCGATRLRRWSRGRFRTSGTSPSHPEQGWMTPAKKHPGKR